MNYAEFCNTYWKYYLVLEADFLCTERYVSFDLGNEGNGKTYSVEYVKQYQTICSEVEAVLKVICKELTHSTEEFKGNIIDCSRIILNEDKWGKLVNQEVKLRNIKLSPFANWSVTKPPIWWKTNNGVKHERDMKSANLENVLNALAGLFILENYLCKYIGDTQDTADVPDSVSNLFSMINWETNYELIGNGYFNGPDEGGPKYF